MQTAPLVPAIWELPEKIRKRLGRSVGRQRLISEDEHHLIVAHSVPSANQDTRQGVLFWRNERGEWKASNGDPGAIAIANLLEKYEKRLEEMENAEMHAVRAVDYLPILEGLAPIARSSSNFLAVLREAHKALGEESDLLDHRERAYDVARTAELAYQYAKDSMDVAVAKRTEEQTEVSRKMAEASHRLNTMAALFFPIATLSGIFGTTFTEDWSWSNYPLAFLAFVAIGLLAGVGLAGYVSATKVENPLSN